MIFPGVAVILSIMFETPGRNLKDTFIYFFHSYIKVPWEPASQEAHKHALRSRLTFCGQDFSIPGRERCCPVATYAATAYKRRARSFDERFTAARTAAQRTPAPRAQARPSPHTPALPSAPCRALGGHGPKGQPPPSPRRPTWQGSSAVPGSSRRAILQKTHCCPSGPPLPGSLPSAPSCPAPAAASSPAMAPRPPPGASQGPGRGLLAGPAASPWRPQPAPPGLPSATAGPQMSASRVRFLNAASPHAINR